MTTCSCLSCRTQRVMKRWAKRAAFGLIVVSLVGGLLVAGARVAFPPEREAWFGRLLVLAQKADAEYDTLTPAADPESWSELYLLVKEIIYQIEEEGATTQLIRPASVMFADFGPGRRSAVAGTYAVIAGAIVLNERFLTPAWGDSSWLSTLIHELVHAQGYFVGDSSTLESQTEIVATEVLAAMANLDYPGARAELLDGLRRDALAMAYYIARFGGDPIHTTYTEDMRFSGWNSDPVLMGRLTAARQAIFTPTELARSDKRIRWWEERPAEYVQVLGKYVVTTITMELDAACGSGAVAETFQQAEFEVYEPKLVFSPTTGVWEMSKAGVGWGKTIDLPPLRMDDLAYILNELGYC